MIRTPIMPWSAWACSLILGVSALFHLPGWAWLPWLIAALAVAMIGTGIRAFTDTLHYKAAHSRQDKGEDHDKTGPMDRS